MMTKLYELTDQYRGLMNLDVEPDVLADTLEGISGEIQIKAENLLSVISNMGSDADAIDAEIKRLTARKKTISNRQEWLREYLRSNMETSGIDKITCPLFTITLRKATDVVFIEDVDLLPKRFQKITITPDKTAIKAALKLDIEVPGARMVEGKRGLMIR
jgi:hypothetical protein